MLKYTKILLILLKLSELCKMIEESFHSGKYPFLQDSEKHMSKFVQIINRSSSDDLKGEDIRIETRINDLFVLNNYIANIQHLPGMIEMDSIDSFKMLSRRTARVHNNNRNNISINHSK